MLDIQKFTAGLHDYMARALRPLSDRIKALEDRQPVAGRDGERGPEGPPGKDADPVAVDDVIRGLLSNDHVRTLMNMAAAEAVSEYMAANPPAKGDKGDPGERGPEGPQGAPGRDGRDGQAGRDGKDGFDGAKGMDGLNGKDGRDGLGFDDLSVDHDGERGFTIKFTRDEICKEFKVSVPVAIDRGVYRAGTVYERGDGVTFGGSWWIAQKDAPSDKPGHGDGWRLAVKRGRDGRDGADGARGPAGKDAKYPAGGGPY